MEKIQELTDKLYREGVEKGNAEGMRLVEKAKAEADKLVADARKEADEIVDKARKQAQELEANTKSELKLYAGQALNALKASMSSMYAEVAGKMTTEDRTTYNMERLFSTDVNMNQNQVTIKVSSETEAELDEIISLYHAWMERKLAEYQKEYPDAELSMKILDENKYSYYDSDIFSEQRSAADKKTSLQNNITSTKNSIASAQKDINDYKEKISDAETELDSSSEDLYGDGDTEATDPEESSSEFYE